MQSAVYNGIVANPNAGYPPSLNLTTQNNGVTANFFGSNTKAVLFNKESTTTGYNDLNLIIDGILTSITVADSYDGKDISIVLDDNTSYIFTLNTSVANQALSSFNGYNSVSTEKLRRWRLGYGGDGIGDPSSVQTDPVYIYATGSNVSYSIPSLDVPNYFIVSTVVTNFSAFIDNHILGIINNFDSGNFSNCNLEIITGEGLSANRTVLPVTESATISSNTGDLHTLYYFNTGSSLLGLAKSTVVVPNINLVPSVNYTILYLNSDNQTVTFNFNNVNAAQVVYSYTSSISSLNTTINSTPIKIIYQNPSSLFSSSYVVVDGVSFELKPEKQNYININNKEYVFNVNPDKFSPTQGYYITVLDQEQELLNLLNSPINLEEVSKIKTDDNFVRKTGFVGDCMYVACCIGFACSTECTPNGGCQDDGIAGGACECPCACQTTTYPNGKKSCACNCSLGSFIKCYF